MKIQYLSDLHLEFEENFSFMDQYPLSVTGDILVMAGDIVTFNYFEKLFKPYKPFFDFLSENYKAVYWLPGNHEYYRYDIAKRLGSFKEEIYPNIFLVNNQIEEFKDCRIIFSTLWSRIDSANAKTVRRGMSDFSLIQYNGEVLTPEQYNAIFEDYFAFLQESTQIPYDGQTVIVTHHVPTLKHYPPEYAGSSINNGFVTELEEFIKKNTIDYWIYGHHHRNIPAFTIKNTKLLTNQLGYVVREECPEFDKGAYIEV